jgi:trimeric autotransporter adhesin
MSTKTLRKRIALVAVAALGLGVVTSVAPASAAQAAAATFTTATTTATTIQASGRVGVAAEVQTVFDFQADSGATDTITLTTAFSAKPAGSTATLTPVASVTAASTTAGPTINTNTVSGSTATVLLSALGTAAEADFVNLNSTFTPDVAGTYTVLTWHDQNLNGALDSAEAYATKSFVIAADAPTVAMTVYGSTTRISPATTDDDLGALVKVSLRNNAVAASLAGIESLTVAASNSGEIRTADDSAALTTLTRSSFDKSGNAYFRVNKAAAGTSVVTITGATGTAFASLAITATVTFVAATADFESAVALVNTTGAYSAGVALPTANATAAMAVVVPLVGATAVGVSGLTGAAADVVTANVTDSSAGDITGLASGKYSIVATSDADKKISFTGPSVEATAAYTMAFLNNGTGATTVTVTPTAASQTNGSITLDQALSIRAVAGSTVSISGVVKSNYATAISNVATTFNPGDSGKNGHLATTNVVTDASGRISYSITDAPLTGVTATTDSVVVSDGTNSVTVVITWVTSLGVSKVVAYGGNTASTGVDAVTPTYNVINAGTSGASASTVTISAKVTDAAGSIIVGAPVTWTVAGTGVAVPSNKVTSYTDNLGVATSTVYAWTAGTYTYTATSAGVSASGRVSFAQENPLYARTITAKAEGAIVTATAKDRFGNPVKGVRIYATKTGSGYFGNGLSKTDGLTDSTGNVEFNVAGGTATVTVSAVDSSLPSGSTYGQTCAAAGNSDCATTPTAFTASATGTATTAETGVGASFSAAGVASATVEASADNSAAQAADAAAEATDAANAATDAANAAAEAADAATAAAQDAADAVAALSTQVSEMVNALKKQITALTNLVIKIQKKVRA